MRPETHGNNKLIDFSSFPFIEPIIVRSGVLKSGISFFH